MFAYFIPGLTFMLILWYLTNFYCPDLSLSFIKSHAVLNITAFFVFSYISGLIIHELSELLQKLIDKLLGGMPSYCFLSDNSKIIKSDSERKNYKEMAKQKFGIDMKSNLCMSSDLFFQCMLEYLRTNTMASGLEPLNHNYGMCRGLMTVAALYVLIFMTTKLTLQIPINWYAVSISVLIMLIFVRRTRRFGESYVKRTIRFGYQKYKEETEK
jgi:hypothetical protein